MIDVYGSVADHPHGTAIQSALKRWEELEGPLEAIQAHAPTVRRLLKEVDPTRDDITHREWRRVSKLIGEALRHCGLEKMPARFEVPLMAEWQAILESVPKRPYQVAIKRFGRWGSMHGIAPQAIVPEHFDRFAEDLLETTRADLARNVYLALCNAWDRAVDTYPHWPRVRPPHVLQRLWYTRDWQDYPPSIRSEIDQLFDARRNCDQNALSPWRAPIGPDAERTQLAYLRRFLHALCEIGCSPEQFTSLAAVLTPDQVDNALGWMRQRNGDAPTLELYNIAVLLRSIARNWLSLEAKALVKFDEIVTEYRKPVVGPKGSEISEKTRTLLLRLESQELRDSLRRLGKKVLERHVNKTALTRAEALEIQIALAIDLAITTVLNPTRLASLHVDRDIVCRAGKRSLFYSGNQDNAHELPAVTTALLNLYMAVARTRLQPDCGNKLFPGAAGKSKHPAVLTRQIARLVERECGMPITASQFKWVVAVLHLKLKPGDYEFVRDLLGYRTIEAVERVFGPRGAQAAFDRHDDRLATGGAITKPIHLDDRT